MKDNEQLLIISIGIDGGSWEIIDHCIEKGYVEYLEQLVKEGCRGTLLSIPPITYPQWYVLLSGLNPGKIGVYDFVKYDYEKNVLDIVSHSDFLAPHIGDILSKHNIRFALINVPGIIPQKKYCGYIVGDPFTLKPLCYPKSMQRILKLINYKNFDINISKSMINQLSKREIYNISRKLIESRFRLIKYLLINDRKINFIHLTIFITDNIQHFFWVDDLTLKIWRYIDRKIKELINFIERNNRKYVLMIVSDHGFTKIKRIFNLGYILNKNNYLMYKNGNIYLNLFKKINITREKILPIVKKPIIGNIAHSILKSERIMNILQKIVPREDEDVLGALDYSRSKVLYGSMSIYINKKYKNIENELLNRLINFLKDLKDEKGEKVFAHIIQGKSFFSGKYVDKAPDLMIIPSSGFHVISNSRRHQRFWTPRRGTDWIASHTTDAIFILYSPLLSKSCIIRGRTVDYVPTVLTMLGLHNFLKYLDGIPIKQIVNVVSL